MELNILPFLCEAFSTNNKIYNHIDVLYEKDKYTFHKSAIEHELYNHPMAKEGSILQEDYFKKTLGILLNQDNFRDDIENIICKGWRYAYTYVHTHKKIILEDFINSFIRKNGGIDNISDDLLNSNCLMIMQMSNIYEKELEESDLLHKHLNTLQFRMVHYNKSNKYRVNYDNISKVDLQKIRRLKNVIFSRYANLRQLTASTKEQNLDRYISMVECLFDYENLSLVSISSEINFSDRDVEEILYLWILNYDDSDVENAAKFLVDMIRLRYLSKAYKNAKLHYFKNNKESMYFELHNISQELSDAKEALSVKIQTLSELQRRVELLEKQNARLCSELEAEKKNSIELNSLRNFVFNLDKRYSSTYNDETISKINNIKGIIIGGHEKWQQKMKELLPNFKFISVDSNFDKTILENIDIVFIYTNYFNHKIYYKVIDEIRRKDLKLVYLSSSVNEDIVLEQIYKAVVS